MNIFENEEIRYRLRGAFPKLFVNADFELIIHPQRNSYFLLDGVETEKQLNAKILEWLSREAIKGGSRQSQKYHFDGINKFLGTDFTREEMELIYTYLGNCCNHDKTLRFIDSGYDMAVLEPEWMPLPEPPEEVEQMNDTRTYLINLHKKMNEKAERACDDYEKDKTGRNGRYVDIACAQSALMDEILSDLGIEVE